MREDGVVLDAVIFDLDGVLLDSEPVWEEVRRGFVAAHGGQWRTESQNRLMGMSTSEWARYLSGELGVRLPPDVVAHAVVEEVAHRYAVALPLMPGAVQAVRRIAARWPVGLASSSARSLIDLALAAAGLESAFAATVSTEEVERGKPAPDVYLAIADRLGVASTSCVAVEDSTNGLRAARSAGTLVVAIPHPRCPPEPDVLAGADLVLARLEDLTVAALTALPRAHE